MKSGRHKGRISPRPWDKPLVWNPNVDITGIEPEDITAQVVGQGVQIIGGVRGLVQKPKETKQ